MMTSRSRRTDQQSNGDPTAPWMCLDWTGTRRATMNQHWSRSILTILDRPATSVLVIRCWIIRQAPKQFVALVGSSWGSRLIRDRSTRWPISRHTIRLRGFSVRFAMRIQQRILIRGKAI